jgi:hypothetical protein
LESGTNSTAKKGRIWSFTLLHVDLSVHVLSSSISDPIMIPIDEAFCTLFMPEKLDCLTNVEIQVSRDAATQHAAIASCSTPFNVQGFIQAINRVKEIMFKFKSWFGHTAEQRGLE